MQNQIQNIHKLVPNFMDNLRSARQVKQKNMVHLTAQNTGYVSSANLIANSRSNTKFVIRYQQKQVTTRSGHKINRYSSKHQNQVLKQKRISQSFLEKTKLKNKDGSSLPSYLRPTQASISAQLQRNRIASLADMHSNQNKIGSVIRLRSKSIEEEDQQQRQYNRIPIEFYDQKDYGCGADSVRARVVFRGYAPKNTYYYLKTLKPFKRKPKKINLLPQSSCSIGQQNTSPKNQIASIISVNLAKNQFDIRFQSKFQSGNLSAASRISLNEYWLYMREDTNTHGLRQWYYFVAINRKPIKIKFRIYKFTKSYSLYRWGMKPYIRTCLNDVVTQWQQGGKKVKYQFDNIQKCFYVEFEYKFQQQNQEVQFAMLPPYTYTMLKDFMRGLPYQNLQAQQKEQFQLQSYPHSKSEQFNRKNLNLKPQIKQKIKVQVIIIGLSLAGLDLNLIEIKKVFNKDQLSNKPREAIIILGRTHPGQTVSNFSIQSFIQTVLNNEDYVQFYDFFIIPMINPDGVYFGNHRTSIIGQDLNRNFNTNDFQVFPQIQAVHNAINKIKKSHKTRFIIDLHGHSARRNIFAYGDQHQMGSAQYLHTHILPKLLNDSISSFKYDFCIFRESKQKKNTARVHYSNKYKINCLTIQQSYGLLQDGPISIRIWKNFGIALAQCLIQFAKLYENGKQKMLQQYLCKQIQKQKIELEKVLQKHKKMFGIVNQQFRSFNTTCINVINTNIVQRNLSQNIYQNKQKQQINEEHQQQQVQNQKQPNYNQQQLQKQQANNKQQQTSQKHSAQQIQQQKQINLSQLSSGDESLQNKNQQIQQIKKQIYRVGCMKQGIKRQKYNIADKKLKLFEQSDQYNNQLPTFRRMHQQKSSMIPRIAKLQLKRKQEYNLSFKRQFREERRDILQRQRQERRRQIQAKFKKMELPSIRK